MPRQDATTDARPQEVPWATWTLVAANVAVAYFVTGFLPTEESLQGVWWSRATMADGEWWRILTSMFAHGGLIHLAFNMIALLSMGELERELGAPRFVGIYVAAGVGGAIAHVLSSDIPAVGASGAIFGMLGVVLVLAPRMELAIVGLPVPAVLALTLYLSVVLLVPAFSTAMPIAHWAHLGGMFVGMTAAIGINPHQGARHLVYIGLVFVGTLVLVSALAGLAWGELPELWRDEGIVGVLAETWLVWLALAAIYVVLWAMREEEDEGRAHVRS